MIDPGSIHERYEYVDEVPDIIKIDELPIYDRYDYDLADETSFRRYIDSIERDVRNSFEYRRMVGYLRDYMDMNKCSFYENVNNIDTTKIKIEIHHAPFTLADITYIVYNKRAAFRESLEEEMVAKEITISQAKPINLEEIKFKNIPGEINIFSKENQIENIKNIIDTSNEVERDEYKTLLSKKYIYVDTSGAYNLPKAEEIAAMLKSKITELMDNPPEPVDRPKELHEAMIFDN